MPWRSRLLYAGLISFLSCTHDGSLCAILLDADARCSCFFHSHTHTRAHVFPNVVVHLQKCLAFHFFVSIIKISAYHSLLMMKSAVSARGCHAPAVTGNHTADVYAPGAVTPAPPTVALHQHTPLHVLLRHPKMRCKGAPHEVTACLDASDGPVTLRSMRRTLSLSARPFAFRDDDDDESVASARAADAARNKSVGVLVPTAEEVAAEPIKLAGKPALHPHQPPYVYTPRDAPTSSTTRPEETPQQAAPIWRRFNRSDFFPTPPQLSSAMTSLERHGSHTAPPTPPFIPGSRHSAASAEQQRQQEFLAALLLHNAAVAHKCLCEERLRKKAHAAATKERAATAGSRRHTSQSPCPAYVTASPATVFPVSARMIKLGDDIHQRKKLHEPVPASLAAAILTPSHVIPSSRRVVASSQKVRPPPRPTMAVDAEADVSAAGLIAAFEAAARIPGV